MKFCSFSFVPDGYGASGNQLTSLYNRTLTCITHARGLSSTAEYNEYFAEVKHEIQNTVSNSAGAFLRARNWNYDALCQVNGFPQTTYCQHNETRVHTDPSQHFSLRGHGMSSPSRANSVYSLEGNTCSERLGSIIQCLSTLSIEYGGGPFTPDPTFDFDVLSILPNAQVCLSQDAHRRLQTTMPYPTQIRCLT